ncbi:MAG: DJ-1/PfpI family protein [Burkholderiales bacterium]|nr:DJ-1/PfpI family protein [Burkholderiales bacterium]
MTLARPACVLLLYPDFAEYQIAPALEALRDRVALTVLAADLGAVRGEAGLRVLADARWSESVAAPQLVLMPGALDMRAPATDGRLLGCLRAWASSGTRFAAICAGPVVLHAAGLLGGRRYVVGMTQAQRRRLGMDETGFADQPVVRDGPLITARGTAVDDFARACVRALTG